MTICILFSATAFYLQFFLPSELRGSGGAKKESQQSTKEPCLINFEVKKTTEQ